MTNTQHQTRSRKIAVFTLLEYQAPFCAGKGCYRSNPSKGEAAEDQGYNVFIVIAQRDLRTAKSLTCSGQTVKRAATLSRDEAAKALNIKSDEAYARYCRGIEMFPWQQLARQLGVYDKVQWFVTDSNERELQSVDNIREQLSNLGLRQGDDFQCSHPPLLTKLLAGR